MYMSYWNLETNPFSSTPDAKFYFASRSGADPVSGALAAVARRKRLVLLTGVDGSGKTTCLRRIVDLLPANEYKVAFVTNPAPTFPSLLREIVGQLESRATAAQTLEFHAKAFYNAVAIVARDRRHTVAIIDDFASKSPSDMAALSSLLTGHQEITCHATFVVAGPPDLKSRFEEPTCRALFESCGAHCTTEGINSRESMQSYIEHRLKGAGRPGPSPFSEDAIDVIWARPENRLPSQLNSVCRVCLKRCAEHNLKLINAAMAQAVSDSLQRSKTDMLPPQEKAMQYPGAVAGHASGRALEAAQCSEDARARLASQLAAERIRHMDSIGDPFEEWSSARDEILSVLKAAPLRRAAG